jgi:VanZ family protein
MSRSYGSTAATEAVNRLSMSRLLPMSRQPPMSRQLRINRLLRDEPLSMSSRLLPMSRQPPMSRQLRINRLLGMSLSMAACCYDDRQPPMSR